MLRVRVRVRRIFQSQYLDRVGIRFAFCSFGFSFTECILRIRVRDRAMVRVRASISVRVRVMVRLGFMAGITCANSIVSFCHFNT